uniref:4-hydroxyphenylpyruvate dioxygenase n=1 Tax=Polytomella parva TaxID=51329 RepID=A0A7S0UWB0_9CHLO|mmetsp:Transcript_18450/g.33555  ORF Transcript_18450/g.33555 Transcript_18450/m.33555 type:complete len:519 (+) Transcript_18450:227-1783(+)|eukprot:CAMPEP_0175052170 /NCGR_PEP_ID=MMETSP0052_2-20121109/8213_1 /TAXON_ID=51329 ORGANISM="Polytomella parva, Strain SAG 63-3" /NCGR_SAMPLE_ID=MMETSP0052_2 /ASSEMBLY_ACC=CAM_ASM_000194 /LENGTH=518 /DNA_ID=CAMNT_0016316549 /DNA_START=150 /DNA_END=1706 /DNA_ORIENTATION=-
MKTSSSSSRSSQAKLVNPKPIKLVGYKNFVRQNPRSDKFNVRRFHSVEFFCSDATNVSKRFQHGLGMRQVAKSDLSTGNNKYASYVLQSGELVFALTAPYGRSEARMYKSPASNVIPGSNTKDTPVIPWKSYENAAAFKFIERHGLAVRTIALIVDDANDAFEKAVANGAEPVQSPVTLESSSPIESGYQVVSEVMLYGDVVLRFISGPFRGPFLMGYEHDLSMISDPDFECETQRSSSRRDFGLARLDHAVGNVPILSEALEKVITFTGFHPFAEFVAEDVGTVDSGLNSMVLANNNELVLLPMNEPTYGTRRQSQIETYLQHNDGSGLQHLAILTHDIFHTLEEMRRRSNSGGFEFMPPPNDSYYDALPQRIGSAISADQIQKAKKLGILVDRDDRGVLLQIFTKPLGDRPTIFIEIIQRLACEKMRQIEEEDEEQESAAFKATAAAAAAATIKAASAKTPEISRHIFNDTATATVERERRRELINEPVGGCGGFGKGNFSELFKSIEEYEKQLNV